MGSNLNKLVEKYDTVQRGVGHSDGRVMFEDYDRLPCYVFPVDYAFGGGIPFNIISQFYGPPTGGKSTLAILFAKGLAHTCNSCLRPLSVCNCGEKKVLQTFWCSTEGKPDPYWFDLLGYDADKHMYLGVPEYGEEACTQVELAVRDPDCGLVVLDSLAGLVPKKELERSYLDLSVGEQARLIARFVMRVRAILTKELRLGHRVSVLFLNQVRTKIGGMSYGSNETTPGGFASKHGYRLSARINQLAADSDDVNKSENMKDALRFSVSLLGQGAKQQLVILSGKAEYKLAVRRTDAYVPGLPLDMKATIKYARDLGLLKKQSDGYHFNGAVFKTLASLHDFFVGDGFEQGLVLKWVVVQKAKRRFISTLEDNSKVVKFKAGDAT